MGSNLDRILTLEVPIIVRLGVRQMTLGDVLSMAPGMIIELPKSSEDELDLLVNNKPMGSGIAVKVGENFGLRVSYIGDLRERIAALGPVSDRRGADTATGDDDIAALAAQLLAGR